MDSTQNVNLAEPVVFSGKDADNFLRKLDEIPPVSQEYLQHCVDLVQETTISSAEFETRLERQPLRDVMVGIEQAARGELHDSPRGFTRVTENGTND
jgi:hypothetical protein